MKLIDSDALGFLTKALGLTGRGSQVTELTDGVVDQALDVVPIIRRGRTLGKSEGLFIIRMRNDHSGAASVVATLNPYALAAGAVAPFPAPIPAQFDLWLLGASIRRTAGTGTLSAALLGIFTAEILGVSVQGASALAVGTTTHALAFWDAVVSENIDFAILAGDRGPWKKLNCRLPRSVSTQLRFATTSSATSTYDLLIWVGLFPVSLGQDGII